MPPQCEMLSPRRRCLTWNTKKVRSLAGRYAHACTHARSNHNKLHVALMLASAQTRTLTGTHLDFSGCCCVSSASVGASSSFNLWRHYLLTHLSSSKWFLFISCESPNQSWKLNAIQRSHCFQPHSLSLWEWMAAAENSDVLSHRDGESLNVSCDLYRRCLWLKALAGDSTNHVTHLTHCIWVLSVLRVSLSHPLSVSSRSLVHVKKRVQEEGKYKVSLKLKAAVSSWNAVSSLIRRELSSFSADDEDSGNQARIFSNVAVL